MKTLDQQMAVYAAYHRNRWNRLTHFIGVPAIIFAILIPMSWVSLGGGVSLAHVFLGSVLAYYFLLDVPLALVTAVAVGALFFAAKLAAGTGIAAGWIWSVQHMSTARSIVCSSSRTLPGHEYCNKACRAEASSPLTCRLYREAWCKRKCMASAGTSSRRSRNAGKCISTVFSRNRRSSRNCPTSQAA